MRQLIRSHLIWISTVSKCVSEFTWCPNLPIFPSDNNHEGWDWWVLIYILLYKSLLYISRRIFIKIKEYDVLCISDCNFIEHLKQVS